MFYDLYPLPRFLDTPNYFSSSFLGASFFQRQPLLSPQALVSGEKVHSVAEVILLNHEKRTEGVVEQMLQEISYKAVPAALVEKVEIDVSDLKVGDSIKVKDLAIAKDPDIDLSTDPEATVVTLTESRNVVEDDEDAEGEEADAYMLFSELFRSLSLISS